MLFILFKETVTHSTMMDYENSLDFICQLSICYLLLLESKYVTLYSIGSYEWNEAYSLTFCTV